MSDEIKVVQVQTVIGMRWHAYLGDSMIGIGMSEEAAIRNAKRTMASQDFQDELQRQPDAKTEVTQR